MLSVRTSWFKRLVCLLWLTACAGSAGSETLIGYACESADECDVVTGVCVKDGKDGMCTQKCISPGGAGQCPYGSYCTRGEFMSDQGEATMTLCFPACKAQSECRDGYSCNGVSSGPGKVCQPKL